MYALFAAPSQNDRTPRYMEKALAAIPEADRRDFYLYIDEFQNFVTTSFETILSEARKYRLNLTVSHQYLAQLNESTAAAIAGNIGTMISFAVGSEDAEWLARAMAITPGQLLPQDLANLPKHTAYARLLVDGLPRPPFSMTTLPPPDIQDDRSVAVLQSSRRQHSRPLPADASALSRNSGR
ncbi:MAG: type IV secretory system conjugative DNA transfer family protein [Pirellulales bacterium]